MKNGVINKLGKSMMRLSPIKIVIIDDVSTYFNQNMLTIASANGNIFFERYSKCDSILLKNLIQNPRDVIIIDIKGTVTKDIGNDGFDLAGHIHKNTSTFVAIVSAHKYHLKNRENYGDYVISERLMTPIDFSDEINTIINKYLQLKIGVYKKIFYRLGKYLFKYGLSNN